MSFRTEPEGVPAQISGTAETGKPGRLGALVRCAVAIGLLAAVGYTLDLSEAFATLRNVSGPLFLAVCAAAVSGRILMAYKWNLLLRAQGIVISVWDSVRIYYAGFLLGTATPGDLGGDAYRVVAVSRLGAATAVASTVVLEKLLGLAVISAAATLSLPFAVEYLGTASQVIVALVVLTDLLALAALVASLHPRIVGWTRDRMQRFGDSRVVAALRDFHSDYSDFGSHFGTLSRFVALTALEIFVSILVCFFAARAIGIGVSLPYMLSVMPLAFLLIRIPISVGGLGVQEALFTYFFAVAGWSAEAGLATSLLMRVASLFAGYVPGAVFLWWKPLTVAPRARRDASSSVV